MEKKLVNGKIRAALAEDKSIPFVNNFDGDHLLTIKKGTVLPMHPWTRIYVRKDDPSQLVVSEVPADVAGLETWGLVIFDLGGQLVMASLDYLQQHVGLVMVDRLRNRSLAELKEILDKLI